MVLVFVDIKNSSNFNMSFVEKGAFINYTYKVNGAFQLNKINITNFIKNLKSSGNKTVKCYESPGGRFYSDPTKNQKGLGLYFFFNDIKAEGGFSKVYSGYRIDYKAGKVDKVVLKSPAHNNNQDVLLKESNSLDKLYGNDEKLDFIQNRFKVITINNVNHLITKEYEGDLEQLTIKSKPNLTCQFDWFKQMVFGVNTIIKKGFLTTDVKTKNALYEKDEKDNIHVVLCDVNPFTKEDLKINLKSEHIKPTSPLSYTTPTKLTIWDLTALSKIVGKYQRDPESRNLLLEEYFNLVEKMVVFQLGLSCFFLLTKTHLIGTDSLCHLVNSSQAASFIDNEEIECRLKKKIEEIKDLKENKPYLTVLNSIQNLLVETLKVKALQRLKMSDLVEKVSKIDALLKRVQTEKEDITNNETSPHKTKMEGFKDQIDTKNFQIPISPTKKRKLALVEEKMVEWDVIDVSSFPENELKITEEDLKKFLQNSHHYSVNVLIPKKIKLSFNDQVECESVSDQSKTIVNSESKEGVKVESNTKIDL